MAAPNQQDGKRGKEEREDDEEVDLDVLEQFH